MGICGSNVAAELNRSREIDMQVQRDADKERQQIKLLLLGAGESGKSTIFKQMRILYGAGFSEKERRQFRPTIHFNALLSMKTLVAQSSEMGFPVEPETERDMIAALHDDAMIDEHSARSISALWADPGIQQTYTNRARFQLNDSAAYYFNKVAELAHASYVPSVEDVLRSRVRTSGIIEEKYSIDGVEFVIYDVGGQRNERKKWIHCFDGVTAVIFVASLSEYDQVLFEDSTVNRMVEAMDLFDEIANSKWFENSSIILFLNKKDLFEEKIKTVDLRQEGGDGMPAVFVDYTGGCDYEAAKRYIMQRFITLVRREKQVYTHVTCATDTNNVRTVFNACKETILKENMRGSGFMD